MGAKWLLCCLLYLALLPPAKLFIFGEDEGDQKKTTVAVEDHGM